MRVAHIGPPLARLGGPAGYLHELARAKARGRAADHEIVLPQEAPARARDGSSSFGKLRGAAGRLKRRLWPGPARYRPPLEELRVPGGRIDASMRRVAQDVLAEAAPSRAAAGAADVLFAHDVFNAERLLQERPGGAQVWLMLHAPMPIALYLVWSWAAPEMDWREIAALPDVRAWSERELLVWQRADRIVAPCREAVDEVARVDPCFASAGARADLLLSGAAATPPPASDLRAFRRRFGLPSEGPIGLFLGNRQPYRGLDTLVAGLRGLPALGELPGHVAVAGVAREELARHPRIRGLGHVSDVSGLLAAVDFVINVNRFCLFDLSTIEAMQAALPLLLHDTGGNRTLRRLGAGAIMVPDLAPESVASGLARTFSLDRREREALGLASRRCYEEHLTLDRFWERHLSLYDAVASAPVGG